MKRFRKHEVEEDGATGLNHHERLRLLENAVPKQWRQIEDLRRKVADLEFELNRRALPWFIRLFVRRAPAAIAPVEGA